eukprot:CAMPEP_0198512226 /NCGR_PEP_ID=MMETSP1462-20131121/15316_1 /TAXON_ID=1333877 /ORGANISM="Brandtodinium nutriculum, Strain RCC3387" /LENGTH=47 /DNA_ID= /DNA_START= /DNA_END= /DNA_ORIENTATION=
MPRYIFGVTFVACGYPLLGVAAMELGKRSVTGTGPPGVRGVLAYIGV